MSHRIEEAEKEYNNNREERTVRKREGENESNMRVLLRVIIRRVLQHLSTDRRERARQMEAVMLLRLDFSSFSAR